jgi:23S rRNA (uracil1939-C5)-methyltransferase
MVRAVEDREGDRENTLRLRIDSLSHGPYGVARHKGRVILIPRAVPGDEITARIVAHKRNHAVGEPIDLDRASPDRQPPPCPYFASCGGCPWQAVRYDAQLAAKRKNVADALTRIGKFSGFELLAIAPSKRDYHYRRRVRLHVDSNGRLGFHRASSHELVEIESCLIADAAVTAHLGHAREWLGLLKTPVRAVELVVGDDDDGVVLVGKTDDRLAPEDDLPCADFIASHPGISGLVFSDRRSRRCWGRGQVRIRAADGLVLEIDAELFSQVNREGNLELAEQVLGWGAFGKDDRVLELYCGAGNFTLPLARRVREVVAVEGNRRSIDNGLANGRRYGVENIRWIGAPAEAAVKALSRKGERFSKVVLNPPRAGAKDLLADLAALGANKILYVSCEPPTLARDLAGLARHGYRLARARPFDLFPHSYHVETVAEMVR